MERTGAHGGLRRALGRPGGLLGSVLVAAFLLAGLFGPMCAPHDPGRQDLGRALQGPSLRAPLGTDENGCDLLSELLWGARLALVVAGSTVLVSLALGTAVGSAAALAGGLVEEVLMRVTDVLMAFPGILLNLAVVALVAEPSTGYLIFALCLNGWVGFARLARAQVLALQTRGYVAAARAAGLPTPVVWWRHILPHALPALLVQASFAFAGVVLTEASLSFLGLGPPHHYSWGALLSQGTAYLWLTHHLALVAGGAIALVVLGFNLLGDAVQDALGTGSSLS